MSLVSLVNKVGLNRESAKISGSNDMSLYVVFLAWSKENCPTLNQLGRHISELFQKRLMILGLLIQKNEEMLTQRWGSDEGNPVKYCLQDRPEISSHLVLNQLRN